MGQIVNLPIDSSVTLPDSFTSVAGCRGFRGGVLISDRVGPALFRVSLPNREAITIGRVGDGPGEFRALGEIFQYRGDSIAVVDPRLRRILLLDGEGAIARAVSFAGLPMGIDVLGSDSLGRVTFVRRSSDGERSRPESLAIVRWRPGDAGMTLQAAATPPSEFIATRKESSGANVRTHLSFAFPNPFAWEDAMAVLPSGAVVLIRAEPWRYEEWDGRVLRRERPFPWARRMEIEASDIIRERVPDRFVASLDRARGRPPFDHRALIVGGGHQGLLLNSPDDERVRWILILDLEGRVVGRMAIGPAERPCALTSTALVAVHRDTLAGNRVVVHYSSALQ